MKPEISLILSSGGARGLAHIGVIHELEKQGYKITSITGSSIGSLIGGFYASGQLDKFTDWVLKLDRIDVIRLFDISITSKGFIKGEKVFKELQKIIPDQNIEDLKIPFSAVAVDIKNQSEVVFKSGSLYEAIRASVSIPSILTPYKWNNLLLVDGGVLNPIPIEHVVRNGNDIMVVVNLNANLPYSRPKHIKESLKESEHNYKKMLEQLKGKFKNVLPENNHGSKKLGYFQIVTQSLEIMQNRIISLSLEIHKPEIVINLSRKSCSAFEFYKAKEIIDYGSSVTKKVLSSLK